MLLIIGGGILGMMSASAAAKAGGFSEIIVTEQVLGPSGASHYSGGVHSPTVVKTVPGRSLERAPWSWRPWLGRRSADGADV
ncbi:MULTISPECIES: FAD-dependent oxidoreductase [unclassified Mesorhizobium]|uniref:FAD-dependent oxidoreductase n=1 Tax=unclassified Mesorhizobium TaxID=325217 RepID=UPI00333886C8